MKEASDLVAMARQLLTRATPATAGLWPRAAALLARNALEMAVDEYWTRRRIPLDSCPTYPQLICLREYLGDEELAGRVHHAWNALSRACHQHPYELAPTAGELEDLIGTVGEFLVVEQKAVEAEEGPVSGVSERPRPARRARP